MLVPVRASPVPSVVRGSFVVARRHKQLGINLGTTRATSGEHRALLCDSGKLSYEPLRFPQATPDGAEPSIVFPHSFEVGSAELREWLAGSGI